LEETNGAAVIGGKIYVSGGRDLDNNSPGSDDGAPRKTLYVYDPAADSWTRKADLPEESIGGVSGAIGGKLYVLNGESRHFYRYDPASDTWTALPSCPGPHFRGVGAVINDRLYVAGGERFGVNGPIAIRTLHIYDPASNSWTTRAPMPKPVWSAAGARLLGQLYVIGGESNSVGRNYVQAYDPVANAWTMKAPLPTFRLALAAANVVLAGQQRIAAVGGVGGAGTRYLRSNDLYTP
jgi:N-acetylneuraminic acid mutarotase